MGGEGSVGENGPDEVTKHMENAGVPPDVEPSAAFIAKASLHLTPHELSELREFHGRVIDLSGQIAGIALQRMQIEMELSNAVLMRQGLIDRIQKRRGLDPKAKWNINPETGEITATKV